MDTNDEAILGVTLYDICISALYNECGEYKSKILNDALRIQFCDFIEDFIGKNITKLSEHYKEWQKDKMNKSNPGEMIPLCGSEGFIKCFLEHGR